jgi:hypothetical protein
MDNGSSLHSIYLSFGCFSYAILIYVFQCLYYFRNLEILCKNKIYFYQILISDTNFCGFYFLKVIVVLPFRPTVSSLHIFQVIC